MDWLLVVVTVGAAGIGALVVYRSLSRLRRQAHETRLFLDYLTRWLESLKVEEKREDVVDGVPVGRPALSPAWGLDMECGIDVVNSAGKVVGTALVPAPALN